jgi:hypothetical protein
MSWTLIAAAISALALGGVLRWYLKRGWYRYYASPKNVIFPKVCPVCLGPADVLVEETSAQRVAANYVIVRQLEWWKAKIPHCSKCERKQARDVTIGIVLGGLCAVTIFILTPAPDPPGDIIFYAFFAYPFYIFADHLHKGLALGRGDAKSLSVRIRNAGYYDRFLALNNQPAPAIDSPLAGGKGVWRR